MWKKGKKGSLNVETQKERKIRNAFDFSTLLAERGGFTSKKEQRRGLTTPARRKEKGNVT